MTITNKPRTRRSKKRTDDGKGDRRMKAGIRFRTPGVTGADADKRFARIDQLWDDNQRFCEDYLKQDAKWTPNWCGLTRPKSGVIGWWLLWPETVQLLEWLRDKRRKKLGREPEPNERILLTETGAPLYRDESRNAQSGFGNTWRRLHKRIEKNEREATASKLPFGTFRNQMPD